MKIKKSSLNQNGVWTIKFSEIMKDEYNGFNFTRNFDELFRIKVIPSRQLLNLMEISKIKNQTEYLMFNSSPISFIDDTMKINITFRNPLIFHSGIYTKDLIQLTFLQPYNFQVKGQILGNYAISSEHLTLQEIIP